MRDGVIGVFGTIFAIGNDFYLSGISDSCFVSGPFSSTLDVSATFNCAPIGGGVAGYTWTRGVCGDL